MSSTAGPSEAGDLGGRTDERGRPRRGHERGPPPPDLDELGQDRDGHFGGRLGAEVDPRRRPDREDAIRLDALVEQPGPDRGGPGRAGDEADIGHVEPERRGDRLLVPHALAGDDDIRPDSGRRQGRQVVADHHGDPAREQARVGDRIHDGDGEAHPGTELGEGGGDRGGPGHPEGRCGQMRFHVDLQGATRVAGHHFVDDPVAAAALGRRLLADPEQPRLPVGQRAEGLPDDDRPGAAAADEPLDRAVRMDEPARTGSGRRRPADRDHRREGIRAAGPVELDSPFEERDRRGHPCDLAVEPATTPSLPSHAGSPRSSAGSAGCRCSGPRGATARRPRRWRWPAARRRSPTRRRPSRRSGDAATE